MEGGEATNVAPLVKFSFGQLDTLFLFILIGDSVTKRKQHFNITHSTILLNNNKPPTRKQNERRILEEKTRMEDGGKRQGKLDEQK